MADNLIDTFITEFRFRENRGDLLRIERAVGLTVGRIATAAAVAGTAIAAAFTAGAVAATRESIKWESSFTGVRKTVNATEAQFKTLERQLLKMSTTKVPLDPHELAGIAEAAGQLGIQTQNIAAFTETMAQLGVTTNLGSQEAATQLARFANVTNMSQGNFDRLGSTIVHLGNNFATTEAEIVSMGLRMAGTGTQIGLTQPEIMGFATALSSVGIQAELGGTAFSRIAGEMQKAVEAGGADLRGFADIAGVTMGEFAEVFGDRPAEAIRMFVGGVKQMRESGQAVLQPLEDLGFSGIRVRETILKAATAFDLMTGAVNGAKQAWRENTALTKESNLRFATTASKVDFFRNAVKNLGITLASETGTLNAFAVSVGGLTKAINVLTDGVPYLIKMNIIPSFGDTGGKRLTKEDVPELGDFVRTGSGGELSGQPFNLLSYLMHGSETDADEGFFQWRGFTGARGRTRQRPVWDQPSQTQLTQYVPPQHEQRRREDSRNIFLTEEERLTNRARLEEQHRKNQQQSLEEFEQDQQDFFQKLLEQEADLARSGPLTEEERLAGRAWMEEKHRQEQQQNLEELQQGQQAFFQALLETGKGDF